MSSYEEEPTNIFMKKLERLYELKDELNSESEKLDKIFQRRTEIHEGAPAKEGEVEELNEQFLKCSDKVKLIGEEIDKIREKLDPVLEMLES